jgi:hypothetical protein
MELTPWLIALALGGERDVLVHVDSAECPGVDVAQVERLLDLELEGVGQPGDPPRVFGVSIACGDRTHVSVVERTTEVRLEREVPRIAGDDPDRERILAQATARLIVTSWDDLTAPTVEAKAENADEPLVPLESPVPDDAVVPKEPPSPAEAAAVEGAKHLIVVRTGQRFRHLGDAVRLTELGLGYRPFLGPRGRADGAVGGGGVAPGLRCRAAIKFEPIDGASGHCDS